MYKKLHSILFLGPHDGLKNSLRRTRSSRENIQQFKNLISYIFFFSCVPLGIPGSRSGSTNSIEHEPDQNGDVFVTYLFSSPRKSSLPDFFQSPR
jgi:hypothetical protein